MGVLIGLFIAFTGFQYKSLTGIFQFSPFSGWQMANNALSAYRYVDSVDRKEVPQKFRLLDQDVRRYLDTTPYFKLMDPYGMDVNATYMWSPVSPLRIYMKKVVTDDSSLTKIREWAYMAPLYKEYATVLMRNYPKQFVRSYLWPNFVKYYVPPVEFLETYGFNADTVDQITEVWFGYKENKLTSRFKDKNVYILSYYPIICGVFNAVYVMMSFSFFVLGGVKLNRGLFRTWGLFTVFWVVNLLFSVFASPIALRFQIFPLILCVALNFILFDFMLTVYKAETKSNLAVN
ncbi:hypothetical protein HF329_15390 [Chitinophaga oryzae]|uniref:Uncharacterized protein n=1 Tax=Chitinophaga oryzae TaxID=2725414 RepID=A0AAE6ZJN7_9BACT|nr:hypothetical protein [Chitinophaga oryzae]QJB32629.1 hypothetical protein HF329_15390 [Chitinophaga oryzae]